MTLMKYNPFGDLAEFSTPMRLLQDTVSRLLSEPASSRPWAPPVDIMETDNELVFKADLPDVNMGDIDLRIENGTLTIKGERKFEEEQKSKGFHRIERSYGAFVRCFSLPETVDPDKVKADYKNGVLTVTLGKKELAKPRTVKVEVKS